MELRHGIIDGEDEDYGDTILPQWDEMCNVLIRNDEKEYKRKTLSKVTKSAFGKGKAKRK